MVIPEFVLAFIWRIILLRRNTVYPKSYIKTQKKGINFPHQIKILFS
jgi:hypothetical protein